MEHQANEVYHFFSLQYSAIQKTILRHDRLWSMAGISASLSRLNEITLPEITEKHNGTVMVAGGGKYTGRFNDGPSAKAAREEVIAKVSTTFPMLEFQVSSQVIAARTLEKAKENRPSEQDGALDSPGLVRELNAHKRMFRGYGVTFNPHMRRCDECDEYPATQTRYFGDGSDKKALAICSICGAAMDEAKLTFKEIIDTVHSMASSSPLPDTQNDQDKGHGKAADGDPNAHGSKDKDIQLTRQTTIQKIYSKYYDLLAKVTADLMDALDRIKIPYNFEDLFPASSSTREGEEQRKRMAVWFSDINNMNGKVPIWLAQKDEEIFSIFETVKSVYIDITAEALADTFYDFSGRDYLPFRIVIAGGDDLCLVMDERYILSFTVNLSDALHRKRKKISTGDKNPSGESENPLRYLNTGWLKKKADAMPIISKKDISEQHDETDDDVTVVNNKTSKGGPSQQRAPLVIKPYSFGASFVISDLHTPFTKIHEVGEELMSRAKIVTDRWDNSVNWRIMADDNAVSDQRFAFEKPLFIDGLETIEFNEPKEKDALAWEPLSFKRYIALCRQYRSLSTSHMHQIIQKMMTLDQDATRLERWLISLDGGEGDKSFSGLLTDDAFRCFKKSDDPHAIDLKPPKGTKGPSEPESEKRAPHQALDLKRLMTLFELLSINKLDTHDAQ